MVSFLLIISFLLHIITLFAVFQLFKQLQTKKQSNNAQEVMEVLQIYLDEIKQENNELKSLLKQEKVSTEEKKAYNKQTIQDIAEKKQNREKAAKTELSELDDLVNQLPGYQVDASLESRVLQLHSKGKSIEEIAKALDCGKTEAELIIKLYQKA